ncbi:hypothetical protein K437DRAFT_249267 [Tilletiaria anomala UBC 951]|uniref:Peptide N-acetyl-beta-D-glucosaminyl asparaginase amidase A N-terminal domain-containing protein n=1 Tax=Tilletiaria anomala (strain ATCC 24038 / CBS 436.72 / UBC 951) TaxID=1037660 RepID=A0A066VKI4_TILAU|nr:uncharacterized protein K437DRAFT_249267 [Tilletiaria anomala UBC 951]KDN41981.1 hypothetical protein K437DRAFT_249267 [Tilletiaria anomala UBC 951]
MLPIAPTPFLKPLFALSAAILCVAQFAAVAASARAPALQSNTAPHTRFGLPLRAASPLVGDHSSAGQSQTGGVSPAVAADAAAPTVPLRNFEVNVPPRVDSRRQHLKECKIQLISRAFANSYGDPSVFSYSPSLLPVGCSDPNEWVSIVLEQNGTSKGRQFDRLGTVWLGNEHDGYGLELWRTDNPEPTSYGIVWSTRKDVSKYWPFLSKDGKMVFDYPNIVDSTYTGILDITLSLSVYLPNHPKQVVLAGPDSAAQHVIAHRSTMRKRAQGHKPAAQVPFSGSITNSSISATFEAHLHSSPFLKDRTADVLIPLSTRQSNGNSLFSFGGASVDDNSSPSASGLTIVSNFPRNALSAIVEIYASGTAAEEFWYTSIPDEVYKEVPSVTAHNLGLYPRGPFREVQLLIDDKLAGIALPYATIFTGGINPLMWRPEASFGAWDQPTYLVDITPFLGSLSDGNDHTFRLRVVSAEKNGTINASWFLSGNVQVHIDPTSDEPTTGEITRYGIQPFALPAAAFRTAGKVQGDLDKDGSLTAEVRIVRPRTILIEANVSRPSKSHQNDPMHVSWKQEYSYSNFDSSGPTLQVINQTSSGKSRSTHGGRPFLACEFDFLLDVSLVVDSSTLNTSVDHRYEALTNLSPQALNYWLPSETTIHMYQTAQAASTIQNGSITSGFGMTSERYSYSDSKGYTFHRTTSANNTKVTDKIGGNLAPYALPVV